MTVIIQKVALVLMVSGFVALGSMGAAGVAQAAEVELIGKKGMAEWRTPTGTWQNTGGAKVDADNPKALVALKEKRSGTIIAGHQGKTKNLISVEEFGDCQLHVEFMVPANSNSGVYLMARYEVQVFSSFGVKAPTYTDCGGIYQRWDNNRPKGKQGYEGHSPKTNASKPDGQWQTFDITFRAPRFDADGKKIKNAMFVRVMHNGVTVHENVEVTGTTRSGTYNDEKKMGPLMLQGDHGPVAYRNIVMKGID